jgi:hypothetical protein
MGVLLAGGPFTGLLNIPYAVIIKPVKRTTSRAKPNRVLMFMDMVIGGG